MDGIPKDINKQKPEHIPGPTKRTRFSTQVTRALEHSFATQQNPGPQEQQKIADQVDLTRKQVQNWFQNRRNKLRKLAASNPPRPEIQFLTPDQHLQQLQERLQQMQKLSLQSQLQQQQQHQQQLQQQQLQQQHHNPIPLGPHDVLCEGFGMQISRAEIDTLKGGNHLNDAVIHFYMNLLMERGNGNNMPKVHAFNTFFYTKIFTFGYEGVKQWTKNIDIFSMEFILVPVPLEMHWCLAVIDFRKKEINYYDSLGGNNDQCLHTLKLYLMFESMDKRKQPLETTEFTLTNVKDIPRQMNDSDCGVFVCQYAECITRRADITFSQEHIPDFRHRMVYEFFRKQLL